MLKHKVVYHEEIKPLNICISHIFRVAFDISAFGVCSLRADRSRVIILGEYGRV